MTKRLGDIRRPLCHFERSEKSFLLAVRDSRFPHMCRAVPLSSSVFHAASALSAPSGHLPLEGKAIKFGVSLTYDVFPRSLPKQRKASTIEESSPRRQSYDYTNGHS